MHKFVRNLVTEWRRLKLPFSGATIVVAVSGGGDSVALLQALADLKKRGKLELEMVVAHLNHGLRGAESDADAEFVRRLAEELGLAIVVGEKRIPLDGNLEQNARRARYEFLGSVADERQAALIVTAHTMNDQAETVLMNLLRGSGVSGLSGMKADAIIEDGGQIRLVRPLLCWAKREDSTGFCDEMGFPFRTDSMNLDERFTRVRIRRNLIPALREYNPRIVDTLARTALALQHAIPQIVTGVSESLSLAELRELDHPQLYARIRSWLKTNRGDLRGIGLKHYDAIVRLINSTRSGRIAELPGGSVVKSKGRLSWRVKCEKE